MSDLIGGVLSSVQRELESHMQLLSARGEAWTSLSPLTGIDGQPFDGARNKLVIAVHNITRETNIAADPPPVQGGAGAYSRALPPLNLAIDLAIIANFDAPSYAEALTALSWSIAFLHRTPVFAQANSPALPPDVAHVAVEPANLGTVEVQAVTAMLGFRYLPSAYYKLRIAPRAARSVDDAIPPIPTPPPQAR